MIYAKEMKYTGAIFEGDALVIISAVNSKLPCDSSYGHFVEDVKAGLASMGSSKFVHVKREANSAAHNTKKKKKTHLVTCGKCHVTKGLCVKLPRYPLVTWHFHMLPKGKVWNYHVTLW